MTEHRMLDFVRALVVAEPDVIAPSVAPVRFQVRTGFIAPPKDKLQSISMEISS
jgi:hypothetical protein